MKSLYGVVVHQYEMKSLLKGQEPQEVKKMLSERKFSMNALWNDS